MAGGLRQYGVSVFFVLSGYSLAHAYGARFANGIEADAILRYARRRIGRLLPLFSVILIASLAGRIISGAELPDAFVIFANLTLLFGFVEPALSPVIGGWSIGIEVVFYVAFPLLLALRRYFVGIILSAIFTTSWISTGVLASGSLESGWTLYVAPANHMVFFVCGAYAGLWLRQRGDWPHYCTFPAIAAILAIIAFLSFGADQTAVAAGPLRAALVPLAIALVVFVSRIRLYRSAKIAAIAGGASYPLYLLHPLVYFLGERILPPQPIHFAALLAAAIMASVAVDRLLDKPLQQRIKNAGW